MYAATQKARIATGHPAAAGDAADHLPAAPGGRPVPTSRCRYRPRTSRDVSRMTPVGVEPPGAGLVRRVLRDAAGRRAPTVLNERCVSCRFVASPS